MYVAASGASTTARKESLLEKALQRYFPTYRAAPSDRPAAGAEVVALLRRAAIDGVALGGYGDPVTVAERVAESVATSTVPEHRMAAIKAATARDDHEAALRHADAFVTDPAVGAYQINRLIFDLVNLWQIDEEGELGAPLLGLLKSGLLDRPDFSHVEFTPAQVKAAVDGLEKVFGKDGVVTLKWYRNGLERSRSVAKIEDRGGAAKGTGFLVPGESLHEKLAGSTVMITNNHVIASEPDLRVRQLLPNAAVVRFQALEEEGGSAEVEVTDVVFESPITDLDVSVLVLSAVADGAVGYRFAADLPPADGTGKVYVIGHPLGGTLSYSIDDNVLIDFDDRVLHYRSPTEPGSSGSPLFDRNWDLIGLHSRGNDNTPRLNGKDGTYATNVGFRISAVRDAMSSAL
jgi:S1-C subfamily serine protease